jgi:sugar/nucleoside kinase (ribokinase family)
MSAPRFDVLGIGNAIVDVLAHAEDHFITDEKMVKGTMVLIDAERAEDLYAKMGPGTECSGGSAANTVAGIASLGGKPAFIGKLADDILGKVFKHDIVQAGVHYGTPFSNSGTPSARCLVNVTPDGQRTMSTFIGACAELSPADIDEEIVQAAQITYIEGYQWDAPSAKDAILKAATVARTAGQQVALTLSDTFCVERHRAEFQNLVHNEIDILFANEEEIKSLYDAKTFDEALQEARKHCNILALTRGPQGSVVVRADEVHILNAEKAAQVVDTTGAGDQFAAGFLFGLTQNMDLPTAGKYGHLCAAEIISHFGARPEIPFAEYVAERHNAA